MQIKKVDGKKLLEKEITHTKNGIGTSVALIGCGRWGRNLARTFNSQGVLTALSDLDEANAEAESQKYDVPVLQYDEILESSEIDAVAIATPAVTHFELAQKALLAGKHVFVEKPMSMNTVDARTLCDLAEQCKLTLMVGHLMQYHPAFLKLKELCALGKLGRVRYICSNRLNLGQFRNEENILWSFAPHDISMILGIIDREPTQVSAVGHAFLNPQLHDMTITSITFDREVAAHTYVSWLHPFKEQRFVVIGENAMAVFDDGLDWDQKLAIYNHEVSWQDNPTLSFKGQPEFIAVDQAEPLKIECAHFIDSFSNGTTPTTNGREGLRVLEVLSLAQQSLQANSWSNKPLVEEQKLSGSMVHETSRVDENCEIGVGTRIWHYSHVLKNTQIGENCNVGQNVMIGPDVKVGNGCKIQNNVSIYPGVELEDNVFCGPNMTFTNVVNPRSEIERKHEFKPTLVKRGATIGANATILCDTVIGKYGFIGAGAVVTKSVPDYGLIVGNPGRLVGYMCACGINLPDGEWVEAKCKSCDRIFERDEMSVREKEKEDK